MNSSHINVPVSEPLSRVITHVHAIHEIKVSKKMQNDSENKADTVVYKATLQLVDDSALHTDLAGQWLA